MVAAVRDRGTIAAKPVEPTKEPETPEAEVEPTEPEAKPRAVEQPRRSVVRSLRGCGDLRTQQLRARVEQQLPKERLAANEEGRWIYTATSGDDDIAVTQTKEGGLEIHNASTGRHFELTAEQANQGVLIRGAGGDDRIDARATNSKLQFEGGDGNDRIIGGAGNDRIDGGDGDDVLLGGAGDDRISGDAGDDTIQGQRGMDQLLGGDGDDRLYGGSDGDVLMGDAGRDVLASGTGPDSIYADAADDSINPGARGPVPLSTDGDADIVIATEGTPRPEWLGEHDVFRTYDPRAADEWLAVNPSISIEGTDAAQRRTRADLGVLLGTKSGRGLLEAVGQQLRAGDRKLVFGDSNGPGGTFEYDDTKVRVGMYAEAYSNGSNRSPLPVLFHELVHAHQALTKTTPGGYSTYQNDAGQVFTVKNRELATTGLPWIDADGALHEAETGSFSDNAFRREVGLPPRDHYSGGRGTPNGYSSTQLPADEETEQPDRPPPWWT